MFRFVLRRILWLLPALGSVTLVVFASLAWVEQHRTVRGASIRLEDRELPLFISLQPRDVRATCVELVNRLSSGQASMNDRLRLLRTGAAAFPHVLPMLDAMSPDQRGYVALALDPIGVRMGVVPAESVRSGHEAAAFWQRFWQERADDFKSVVVRRAVRRLAARGSAARHNEIVELDTFALEELIESLGEIRSPEDVGRAARIIEVTAYITGRDDVIDPQASADEASRCASRWRSWWIENRSSFVVLSGPGRLAATVIDTQYGRWLSEVFAHRLGIAADGTPVLDKLMARSPKTAVTTFVAWLGAYALSLPLALWRAKRVGKRWDRAIGFVGVAIYGAPSLVIAVLAAALFGPKIVAVAAVAAIISCTIASPAQLQRLTALGVLASDAIRTARSLGVPEHRVLTRHVGAPAATTLASVMPSDLSIALTGVLVVERLLGMDGLSRDLVEALRVCDLRFLMIFGIGHATLMAMLTIVADLAASKLDPRMAHAFRKDQT